MDKVNVAKNTDWGGSTNFEAALNMILEACVKHNIPVEEVKEIVFAIFSDMQFDEADDYNSYYHSHPQESFSTKYFNLSMLFVP